MPKGYWIARVDVRDPEGYMEYIAAATPVLERFGAKFLTLPGTVDTAEGPARARNVVIEFASLKDARDCFNSPEYQRCGSQFDSGPPTAELVVVEGIQ